MPGPIFEAGPGWGEKLKKWLSKKAGRKVIPAVAVAILLWGIASFFSRPTQKVSEKVTANQMLAVTVKKGDGAIYIARRALAEYLLGFPEIDLKPEQKIYIDNYFKMKLAEKELVIGQAVEIDKKDLEQAVNEALLLSEAKLKRFRAYVQ